MNGFNKQKIGVKMLSLKSYLIQAFYDWISDSQCTPYIVVEADAEGVMVPREYVQEGRIVLDISYLAVKRLKIEKEFMSFQAEFDEVWDIFLPIESIMAIYAHENGRGMIFSEDESTTPSHPEPYQPDGAKVISLEEARKHRTPPKIT